MSSDGSVTSVLLDSGPLGLLSNPAGGDGSQQADVWAQALIEAGAVVVVPEIADYEVRRELLRAEKHNGLLRLDALVGALDYLPLSTPVMRVAARLWAQTRQSGRPAAADAALDGDVILAAQAIALSQTGGHVIVATTNVKHLAHLVDARIWTRIEL